MSQLILTDKYSTFKRVVHEDEFQCPKMEDKGGWVSYVDVNYCQSFSGGDGCLHMHTCMAYKKAKHGSLDEDVVIDERVMND